MTIPTKQAIEALAIVQPASGRTTLDAYRAVLLNGGGENLRLYTADDALRGETTIKAEGPLHCAVNHAALANAIATFTTPETELVQDGDVLVARGGKAKYRLKTLPVEDMEAFSPEPPDGEAVLDGQFFRDAISIAATASGTPDSGTDQVLVEAADRTLAVAATNRTKCVMVEKEMDVKPFRILLPTDTARRLVRALDGDTITIGIGRKPSFSDGRSTFLANEYAGESPLNVKQLEAIVAAAKKQPLPALHFGILRRHFDWFLEQKPIAERLLLDIRPDGIRLRSRCGTVDCMIQDTGSDEERTCELAADHMHAYLARAPFQCLDWYDGERYFLFESRMNGATYDFITTKFLQ